MIGRAVQPGFRSPGSPATRSTAATLACGPGWKASRSRYVHGRRRAATLIETTAGTKRADELAALVPAGGWQRLSCADGSKGPRLYDWALIATASARHHLLVRRSLHPARKASELAFFRCYSPRPVTLAELAAVAGARWGVEDCFAEAKNEAGLDHYQVRRYRAWYRHITLSMLAHAFLAVTAAAARPRHRRPPPPAGTPGRAR